MRHEAAVAGLADTQGEASLHSYASGLAKTLHQISNIDDVKKIMSMLVWEQHVRAFAALSTQDHTVTPIHYFLFIPLGVACLYCAVVRRRAVRSSRTYWTVQQDWCSQI
eukprot:COSAG01_NODE_4334_length_5127_cov_10.901750_2_plen_109_part_00